MKKSVTKEELASQRKASRTKVNRNSFEDDEDEEEEQCKSGFYISRRKIAGRHLIAFAQRKVELEDVADREAVISGLGN